MAVEYIKSDNLTGITHGFFTRRGGCSTGAYASLNCGAGSNDNPENVAKNRSLAMQALGFENEKNLYSMYQIHSSKVLHLDTIPPTRIEGDAMVTNTPNIALGILTADCTPVLFADKTKGIIGAAHAGWKGAIGGVLENTIEQMEKLGASRKNIVAAIGPTIAQESYEVGQEFYENFMQHDSGNHIFFINSLKEGHFMFNLPQYVATRLQKAEITNIEDCRRNTLAEGENFFSYRRNTLAGIKEYGRGVSIIVL